MTYPSADAIAVSFRRPMPAILSSFLYMKIVILVLICSIGLIGPHAVIAQNSPPSEQSVRSVYNNKTPFYIDEKNLRQLSQLIERRINEQCPNRSVEYEVRFADGYSYVTSNLDSILQEDNREPRKIESVEIRSSFSRTNQKDPFDLSSTAFIKVELSGNNYLGGINAVVEGHQRD